MCNAANAIRGYLEKELVDKLARTSACSTQNAVAAVAEFKGDLEYISLYADMRNRGHPHDRAMGFLRNDLGSKKKEDHLLACVSEECGEVVQMIGKAHRFGSQDYHPATLVQNWPAIQGEVHDVVAVYELLCMHMGTTTEFSRDKLRAKQEKTVRLMKEHGVIR